MRSPLIKATAAGFATALVAAAVVIPPASASTTKAVPFSQATFNGYATGDELHLGLTALGSGLLGSTPLSTLGINGLDQGFSAASTNSHGLTSAVTSEINTVVQPAQAAGIKAFDEGAGLQLNLPQQLSSIVNTVLAATKQSIPAPAVSLAPPNLAGIQNVSSLNLDPILNASNLVSEAQANFPTESCPASDISYGEGNLTAANLLSGLPSLTSTGVNSAPLLSTQGTDSSVAQTKSVTSLVPNGDGTFGIQTVASEIIAPITVNLLGLATLQIGLHSSPTQADPAGVNHPITLTSTTSGEDSVPATVKMTTDDILSIVLTAGGNTVINQQIPLSTLTNGQRSQTIDLSVDGLSSLLSQLTLPQLTQFVQNVLNTLPSGSTLSGALNQVLGALNPVLSPVEQALNTVTPTLQQIISQLDGVIHLDLGQITIQTLPHAIGGGPNSTPQTTGGTAASAAYQLLSMKLGLTGSSINIPAQVVNSVPIPVTSINLPDIPLAAPTVGALEVNSSQQQPIACETAAQVSSTTLPPVAQKSLPFTGGPGGLWQPAVGIGTLGIGGFSLALVRRLRKRSAA